MVQPLNTQVPNTLAPTATVKIAGQTVERATLAGLKAASAKSGVSFQYLVAKAAQESSLNPEAHAATSSAAGLFQFTRGTWLDMMHRYGSQYGYGDLARQITMTDSGEAVVRDVAAERRLLALREDPEASGLMAAAYAQDNAATLEDALGRLPDAPDLYLAHFLGASGAATLLNAAAEAPDTAAADLLPAAAKANRAIFYTGDGAARSAAEAVALIRGRFDSQMDRFADAAETDPAPDAIDAREQVRMASRTAAATVAHGLQRMAEKDATARTLMQMLVLEEMAKLIASRPMRMTGDEDEDGDDGGFSLTPAGFHGQDFAAVLTRVPADPGAPGLPKHQRGPSAYRPATAMPPALDDLL